MQRCNASHRSHDQLEKENQLQTRSLCLISSLCGLLMALPAAAQQPASKPEPALQASAAAATAEPASSSAAQGDSSAPPAASQTTPAAAPTWSVGPIDFSGAVDGYYSWNFNHPASRSNQLYNFNIPANQFSLSLAKISLAHTADPVGFQIDFGYGQTMKQINQFDNDNQFNQYLEQAFVSFKPTRAKGFELDFGKFVTSAGAEVIESYSNWNYSRSLLFSWAIPYYHFGARTSMPLGKHFTAGFQVVNGWNNLVDNNSGKTIGVTGLLTYSKFSWATNYYGGPENANTNEGWRHLIDTTLTLTPSSKFNVYLNYDYGQNRNANGRSTGSLATWSGFAGAVRVAPNAHWSFTGRGEWFNDAAGFNTGVTQQVKEVTATGEYKFLEGLLWRAEYRHDWSNAPFFDRGTLACNAPFSIGACPANFGLGNSKKQDTVTIALVAYFGPKR